MENITMEFPVKDFHLDHIFDCGQCFRWNRDAGGSYVGTAGGRIARMEFLPAEADRVVRGQLRPCTEGVVRITQAAFRDRNGAASSADEDMRFWREYLDMDRDYGRIKRSLARGDKAMARAIREGEGIRLLKQDLWETMVSFIISQNNNIPRIKGCIEILCREFGEPVIGGIESTLAANDVESENWYNSGSWYNIPRPEVLASLSREDLEVCRLGYRAPYLIDTARQVLEQGGMDAVKAQLAQAEDVTSALIDFAGVGPKVASCIALFGAGRADAFPIDVWMRRAMHTVYGIDEKNLRAMERYAAEHFGKYGGYAQQYLFYYIRGLEDHR